jgi:hypothetical protein
MSHFYTHSELLLESALKQYLADEAQMLANVLDSENDALKFSRWKSETATPVEIVPYASLPIASEVDSEIKRGILKIKMKQCYDNSFWTAVNVKEAMYCEGLASKYIPIDHAWNSYEGSAFDLTGEIALKDFGSFDEHAQLIELSKDEAMEYAMALGHSGPFSLAYFYRVVLKKWNKKTISALKRMF